MMRFRLLSLRATFLLKADGVIKPSANHQTPGWAPLSILEPPTLAGKTSHIHTNTRMNEKKGDEVRNSARDHSTVDSY